MKKELFNTSFKLAADHNFIIKMHKEQKVFFYINEPLAIFDLGGFAESNKFLMRIESLKILLDNNVPQDEIHQSDWYRGFSRDICLADKNHISTLKKTIQEQKGQTNQLSALQEDIKEITNYSIWRHPLKKYESYKAMLLTYLKINNFPKESKSNE